MVEPSYHFTGNFTALDGEVLPFLFSSPFLVIDSLLGNAPDYYYQVGYATPIFNSDIGSQLAGSSIRLAFGKRFYSFNPFPFDPSLSPYQLKINLKSWIGQLEANYYEVTNWKIITASQQSENLSDLIETIEQSFPPVGGGVGGGGIPPNFI
jgi:hypothetical protein